MRVAAGISLMTVLATSSVVAAGSVNRDVINLRLGIMLQIPAVAGGLIGAESVESFSRPGPVHDLCQRDGDHRRS